MHFDFLYFRIKDKQFKINIMQLPPNNLLQGGKYKIESVLGQGGFGITYQALQTGLNRQVAIKEFFMKRYCERDLLTCKLTVSSESNSIEVESYRRKFIKEAQIIASLDHPNIIRIYDVFEENNTAYYVMEYIDGGSLEDCINKHGALTETEALYYIHEIAYSLEYIHQRNINHFDVKPSNILLRHNTQNLVLIDFGLAKHYDEQGQITSTTPIGISFGYAPLEQYKQGGVNTFSPASDIYSLGAVLYKLLTGQRPMDAEEIFNNGFPELSHNLSSDVSRAIRKAMEPRKKDRPQTIKEFLELLDNRRNNEESIDETIIIPQNNKTKVDNFHRIIINGLPVRWNFYHNTTTTGNKEREIKNRLSFIINRMQKSADNTYYIDKYPLLDDIWGILYDKDFTLITGKWAKPLYTETYNIFRLLNTLQLHTGLPFRLPFVNEWQQELTSSALSKSLLYNPFENTFYTNNEKGLEKIQDIFCGEYCIHLVCDANPVWFENKNGKYALYNAKGDLLSPHKYDSVELWNHGFARVWIADKVGMINQQGEEVIPVAYDSLKDVNPYTCIPGPGPWFVTETYLGTEFRKGEMRGCFRVKGKSDMSLDANMTAAEWKERETYT